MTNEEIHTRFLALSREAQIDALVLACEPALVSWTTWALRTKPEYVDTVVGMRHVVDIDLPARALEEVRRRHEAPDVLPTQKDYVEPIVAMQDDDWEMSEQNEYAYYAIYNLHRFVFEPQDTVTASLVLNQAISATLRDQDSQEEIRERLLSWWARVAC